jgi:hypothetical protein
VSLVAFGRSDQSPCSMAFKRAPLLLTLASVAQAARLI